MIFRTGTSGSRVPASGGRACRRISSPPITACTRRCGHWPCCWRRLPRFWPRPCGVPCAGPGIRSPYTWRTGQPPAPGTRLWSGPCSGFGRWLPWAWPPGTWPRSRCASPWPPYMWSKSPGTRRSPRSYGTWPGPNSTCGSSPWWRTFHSSRSPSFPPTSGRWGRAWARSLRRPRPPSPPPIPGPCGGSLPKRERPAWT